MVLKSNVEDTTFTAILSYIQVTSVQNFEIVSWSVGQSIVSNNSNKIRFDVFYSKQVHLSLDLSII